MQGLFKKLNNAIWLHALHNGYRIVLSLSILYILLGTTFLFYTSESLTATSLRLLIASQCSILIAFASAIYTARPTEKRQKKLAKQWDTLDTVKDDAWQNLLGLKNLPQSTQTLVHKYLQQRKSTLQQQQLQKSFWTRHDTLLSILFLVSTGLSLFLLHPQNKIQPLYIPLSSLNALPYYTWQLTSLPQSAVPGDIITLRGTLSHTGSTQNTSPTYAVITSNHETRRYIIQPQKDQSFSFTLPNLQNSLELYFTGPRNHSQHYTISVLPPPQIEAFALYIIPPAYTGLPPTLSKNPAPKLSIPQGSQAHLFIQNSHLKSANLAIHQQTATPNTNNIPLTALTSTKTKHLPANLQNHQYIELIHYLQSLSTQTPLHYLQLPLKPTDTSTQTLTLSLTDRDGRKNRAAWNPSLSIIPDTPPTITWVDTSAGLTAQMPVLGHWNIPVTITDDYGISSTKIGIRISSDGYTKDSITLDLFSLLPASRGGTIYIHIPTDSLGIQADNEVALHIHACDNNNITRKSCTYSSPLTLLAPTISQVLEQVREESKEALSPLNNAKERAAKIENNEQRLQQSLDDKLTTPPNFEEARLMRGEPLRLANEGKQLSTSTNPDFEKKLDTWEKMIPPDVSASPQTRSQQLDKLLAHEKEALKTFEKNTPVPQINDRLWKAELTELITQQELLKNNLTDQNQVSESQQKISSELQKQQEEISRDLEKSLSNLEKMLNEKSSTPEKRDEILRMMERIEELAQKIIPDEEQKRLQDEATNGELDPEKLKQNLDKLASTDLYQELKQTIRAMEQLLLSRELEQFSKTAADLAEKQSQLEKQKASDADNQKSIQTLMNTLQNHPTKEPLYTSWKKDSLPSYTKSKQSAASLTQLSKSLKELSRKLSDEEYEWDVEVLHRYTQEAIWLQNFFELEETSAQNRQQKGWDADPKYLRAQAQQICTWLTTSSQALAKEAPDFPASIISLQKQLTQKLAVPPEQWPDVRGTAKSIARQHANIWLALLQSALSQPQGGSSSGGSSKGKKGKGEGSGSQISGRLKGMAGQQMRVNGATKELLKSMLDGRDRSGRDRSGQDRSGRDGQNPNGQSQQGPQNSASKNQTLGENANTQSQMAAQLEALNRGEGGQNQKLSALAEEARQLEQNLRQGRITGLTEKQDRFRSKLLEAAKAFEQQGQDEKRKSEQGRTTTADTKNSATRSMWTRELEKNRKDMDNDDTEKNMRQRFLDYYRYLLGK